MLIIDSAKFGIFEVLFDFEDLEFVQSRHWCISKCKVQIRKYFKYYVVSKGELLHRLLMKTPKGKITDHIDGETMNNRKYNLRICTTQENTRNSKHRENSTTGHKGITWHDKTNKWMAYVRLDYKFKNLGYFDKIEDAIKARENAEIEYFGEFRKID